MSVSIRSTIWAGATLLAVFLATEASEAEEEFDVTARHEIETLISLPHGFGPLHPESEGVLKRIKSMPDKYIPIIEEVTDDRLKKEDWNAVKGLSALLSELSMPAAWEQLGSLYLKLVESGGSKCPAKTQAQRAILSRLGENQRFDMKVANRCLEQLEDGNSTELGTINIYLTRTAKGNKTVIDRLRNITEDKNSSLYKHPELNLLIQKLNQ